MKELPILHKLTLIYKTFYLYLASFPQKDKYSLGNKCESYIISTLELLLTAEYASKDQKLQLIRQASVKFDMLKFFIRLAWELKILDQKKYILLEAELQEIGRQLGGWQRSLK